MGARKLRGLRDDGFNFHCQVGVKFSVRRMRKEGDKGRKQKRADKDSSGLAGQEVEEDGKVGDRVAMATVCSLSSHCLRLYSAAPVQGREQTGRKSYVPGFIKS